MVNGMCLIRELEHGVDGQLLCPAEVNEDVHEAAVAALSVATTRKTRISTVI